MSQIKLPVAVMALHFEGAVSQQRRNIVSVTGSTATLLLRNESFEMQLQCKDSFISNVISVDIDINSLELELICLACTVGGGV